MTDEPFGRQPKPVTITITDGDQVDRDYWQHLIIRAAENVGADTNELPLVTTPMSTFRIYPRAVND